MGKLSLSRESDFSIFNAGFCVCTEIDTLPRHFQRKSMMKQKPIWMAVVDHADSVVFRRACRSEYRAQKALVEYLCTETDFAGKSFDEACFWIGENSRPIKLQVFSMQPEDFIEVWSRLATFRTDLPLQDKGLYRVIYEIDVGASSAIQAAKTAHALMIDSQSLRPVLDVIDDKGNKIRIDLAQTKKGKTHAECTVACS
jgi:hypothetical protein